MATKNNREVTPLDELPRIGAPATRAVASIGITTLGQVAGRQRDEVLALHGMGPKALRLLEDDLAEHGLALS
jgi:predicted flap endonuclease-1-like 5' DNA nuclease